MAGMSRIGIGLLTVYSAICMALLALSFYVVWWRRRFQTRLALSVPPSEFSSTEPPCKSPSKELLYFLWLNGPLQVEPAPAAELKLADYEMGLAPSTPPPTSEGELQQSRGSGRPLYTISEDEGTEAEHSEGESSFRFVGVAPEVGGDGEVGFFTPCSSPPFCTPTSSPPREVGLSAGEASVLQVTEELDMPEYRLSFSVDAV